MIGTIAEPDDTTLAPAQRQWREPVPVERATAQRIRIGRWRQVDNAELECRTRTPPRRHVVGIALRRMDVRLEVDGSLLHQGPVMPGSFNVTGPDTVATGAFRGPFDALHLSIPTELVEECGLDADAASGSSRVSAAPDPVLSGLAGALINVRSLGASLDGLYADSIGLAIVARLVSLGSGAAAGDRPRVGPLPKWRLKRALAYIEANLSEPVSLADMAAAAGLTRMHFAAQFRAATGLPPHEYLLRRRIELAQEMLARSRTSLVEIALQVGFQTQAHFTTVFKRFSGFPPHAWRQMQQEAMT